MRSRGSSTWRATSQWHYLTDEEITTAISTRTSLYRAFGHQDKTNFVVIQVQGSSNEAPNQTIKNLHKLLMQKGVKAKPYYIKELDIWQLFIFLTAPTPSSGATTIVKNWLSTSWFTVDSETVDVLPNQSPMSVPLQADFTWLNDDYEPILSSSEISLENAASMFLHDLSHCANSLESLSQLLTMEDQIEQPAYADDYFEIEKSSAPEEQSLNPDSAKSKAHVLPAISFTAEQLEILVPSVVAAAEPIQLDDLAASAYARKEEFGDTLDKMIASHEKPTTNSTEAQIFAQSTYQSVLSKPGADELSQAAYSASAGFTQPEISLVESAAFSELEPLPTFQPDQPASVSLDKNQTDVSVSLVEEPAYAAASLNESPADRETKISSAKKTSKHSNTRDGPLVKQKGRPTVRSSLDSFEQLTLPFGLNTS